MKGAVSVQMIIIVTLLVSAALIVLFLYFLSNTSGGFQSAFKGITSSFKSWVCSSIPLAGGLICGG